MKRILSVTLVVLMAVALFVGCASKPAATDGVYKIKTVNGKEMTAYLTEELDGAAVDVEAKLKLFGIEKLEDYMTFALNEDGTLTVSVMGEESVGTWKLDGEKLTLTLDGETMEGTYQNDEITVEMDGDTMVLGK